MPIAKRVDVIDGLSILKDRNREIQREYAGLVNLAFFATAVTRTPDIKQAERALKTAYRAGTENFIYTPPQAELRQIARPVHGSHGESMIDFV